jgi:hypothetical protein
VTATELAPPAMGPTVRDKIDADQVAAQDLRYWSVTTLIGVLDKPALVHWARNSAIDAALRSIRGRESIGESHDPYWHLADGNDELRTTDHKQAAAFVRRLVFERGGRSETKLGQDAHKAFERWVFDGRRPDLSADPEVDQLCDVLERDWFERFHPVYEAAELTVVHPAWGYAGTLDAIVRMPDGRLYVADYKTSRDEYDPQGNPKGPYPEVCLQLAAYRYALGAVLRCRAVEEWSRRFYVFDPDDVADLAPLPEIAGGLVIRVSPERARVHPVSCGLDVHTYFAHVIEVARWSLGDSKRAILPPLV